MTTKTGKPLFYEDRDSLILSVLDAAERTVGHPLDISDEEWDKLEEEFEEFTEGDWRNYN